MPRWVFSLPDFYVVPAIEFPLHHLIPSPITILLQGIMRDNELRLNKLGKNASAQHEILLGWMAEANNARRNGLIVKQGAIQYLTLSLDIDHFQWSNDAVFFERQRHQLRPASKRF